MAGFYDVQNLGDFKVADIPSREDAKQSLAIAKSALTTYNETQRDNLSESGFFKINDIIINTTPNPNQMQQLTALDLTAYPVTYTWTAVMTSA